jgi:histidinol-phosphate aminotransferase
LEFVRSDDPIIVLQTFSKIYGLAGLRVGFGVAPKSIIQSILHVKEPFNVNSLAQAAAVAALRDHEHVKRSRQLNTEGRVQLYKVLSVLGLEYTESMGNFILVKFGVHANDVYQQLLTHGVIVRYGDIWGLPEHIRISIGTQEEFTILIEAISSILLKLRSVNFKGDVK